MLILLHEYHQKNFPNPLPSPSQRDHSLKLSHSNLLPLEFESSFPNCLRSIHVQTIVLFSFAIPNCPSYYCTISSKGNSILLVAQAKKPQSHPYFISYSHTSHLTTQEIPFALWTNYTRNPTMSYSSAAISLARDAPAALPWITAGTF